MDIKNQPSLNYENKSNKYYNKLIPEMLSFLPDTVSRVLVVGCGSGIFGKAVKENTGTEVWGVEPMTAFAEDAEQILDRVFTGTLQNVIDEIPDKYFDIVYFNDVLEHMIDPYTTLALTKHKLSPNGKVISSIPNIRYHNTFLKLLFKKEWTYGDSGDLDRSHLRFFTKKSIASMFKDAGYSVEKNVGINKSKSIRPLLFNLPILFTAMDILYPQYATVAVKKGI